MSGDYLVAVVSMPCSLRRRLADADAAAGRTQYTGHVRSVSGHLWSARGQSVVSGHYLVVSMLCCLRRRLADAGAPAGRAHTGQWSCSFSEWSPVVSERSVWSVVTIWWSACCAVSGGALLTLGHQQGGRTRPDADRPRSCAPPSAWRRSQPHNHRGPVDLAVAVSCSGRGGGGGSGAS